MLDRSALLVAMCVLLSGAAWAQDASGPAACREITAEAFGAEPMMAIANDGVVMKLGEGFEANCAENDRRRGCLVWRVRGRSLVQSNESPQRFFEIPAGVVARVTTQPTFLCEAGS